MYLDMRVDLDTNLDSCAIFFVFPGEACWKTNSEDGRYLHW